MTFTIAPPQPFLVNQDFHHGSPARPTELTIAQAAQILDMPEGGILELFKLGALECRQEGTRRFIDHDELLAYKQECDRIEAWLDEMVRENQEMGLYDD